MDVKILHTLAAVGEPFQRGRTLTDNDNDKLRCCRPRSDADNTALCAERTRPEGWRLHRSIDIIRYRSVHGVCPQS